MPSVTTKSFALRTELCDLLKVSNPDKLDARLMGMKLSPACGRCGGSGHYSFNQVDGSRCYGCNGTGSRKPGDRDLSAVLERAKEAVADGSLDRYLKERDDRAYAKRAMKSLMEAWTATSVAHALSGASHIIRDHEIEGLTEVRAANKRMSDAFQRFSKVLHDKSLSGTEKADIARASLAEIKAVDFEVPDSTVAAIRDFLAKFRRG